MGDQFRRGGSALVREEKTSGSTARTEAAYFVEVDDCRHALFGERTREKRRARAVVTARGAQAGVGLAELQSFAHSERAIARTWIASLARPLQQVHDHERLHPEHSLVLSLDRGRRGACPALCACELDSHSPSPSRPLRAHGADSPRHLCRSLNAQDLERQPLLNPDVIPQSVLRPSAS